MYMLKTLSLDPFGAGRMGAVRPDACRDQGRIAIIFSVEPDAGGGVRFAEEGPSQQRDGQCDESEGKCVVHELHKASGVPKLFM